MDNAMGTSNDLKLLCRYIYGVGMGDFWHEKTYRAKWKEYLYNMYSIFVNILIYGVVFLEFLEVVFNTFPEDLHRDAVSYAFAQIVVFFKLYLFRRKKSDVKTLIREIISVCDGYEDDDLLKTQKRKVRIAIILQFVIVYFSLTMYALEAFRRMYFEGDIFVSVITYWPFYEDRSPLAATVRVLLIPTMFFMMCTMILTETMVVAHLIIMSLKFVTLRKYFEGIEENFSENYNANNIEALTKKLKNDCLNGILMHRELLRLTTKIHSVFGFGMSLQVGQSSGVAVLLLLRVAFQTQQTVFSVFMSLLFMFALFIQLALYLWNAGDITFNAALIPDAIFHCGWNVCPMEHPSHKDMRRLVLMGCAQAQRPVVLKAFGLQELSYQTYVYVLRTTYSIFAVFY